jgi:4-hydroxy-tetrahydrodipicolinate reductase
VTLVEQAARGVAVPYEVIQWGTGNTGAYSLHFLLADPAFNVVGVWVNREQNVGRTAGELAGLAANGPCATRDVDDLVALDADCVVYMAAEPSGPPNEPSTDGWESVETMCRLLDSGKNVVATGISGLTNPRAFGDGVYNRLRLAVESGGTTFFGTGIEPGYMCDALALSLSSISRNISSIRAQECLSYATYDQPNYHVSHGGIWGAPCDPRHARDGALGYAAERDVEVLIGVDDAVRLVDAVERHPHRIGQHRDGGSPDAGRHARQQDH